MTRNDLPTVTIGITAFNSENTIRAAVDSALKQDYLNTNILIVDDCSSDRTHAIAMELATANRHIRIISAPQNVGVAASRNLIINNADTDFIVFFDDDDLSMPDRITKQLNSILACEKGDCQKPIVCHTARIVTYSNNISRYEKGLAQEAGPEGIKGPRVSEAILCGTSKPEMKGACPTCSQMARSATYRLLQGFDEKLRRSEDTDFCIRAAEQGANFIGIKKPLVHQIMTTGDDKNLQIEKENWLYLLYKHRMIIERVMLFSFALSWLDLRYKWLSSQYGSCLLQLFVLITKHPTQTLRKIYFAAPNLELNGAMSKFARDSEHQK